MSLYAHDIELIRERLDGLLARREAKGKPLSQADIARGIGMSPATISNFLNRKDVGDLAGLAAALKAYVEREEARDDGTLLKLPFVETRQAREVMKAVGFCHKFGQLAALIGGSGWGKSRTIQEIVSQDRSIILIRAWNIGDRAVLQKLCEAIRVHETGTKYALMKRVLARLTGSGRCIIVDEAHTLCFTALDALRHVYDETGVGMLLVGINDLKRHLIGTSEKFEQLASRVSGRIYELPPIIEADLVQILRAVLREGDVEPVMKLLRQDPQLLTSVRRMSNFLQIAGILATKDGGKMTLVHVQKALKYAA
jgi:hypothetical protein